MRRCFPAVFACAVLAACAQGPRPVTSAPAANAWAFENSDLVPDPGYRFARLANGLHVVVRHNATPAGTAQVRLELDAGSLDERDDERGFAHFVEHMAFNGSTHVPEGEMIRLLQRDGLAFGADTNAETSFEHTLYKLDLPRTDPKLLDTALMLMRETASELTFAPAAVDRERGVVLSELRDGLGYAKANSDDQMRFMFPRALYPRRLPIGVPETLDKAGAEALKAFWRRNYVPAKATLVVIGDFDPATVDAAIARHFADWQAAPAPPPRGRGKVDPRRTGVVDVWTDPALNERVTVSRIGPWRDEPDTRAQRETDLQRALAYAIVNRRLQRIARQASPPFRDAGIATAQVFHIARATSLVVDTTDGHWSQGLAAAAAVWRSALDRGFTRAELDEQLAEVRQALEDGAAAAPTRSNAALVGAVLALVRDKRVPTSPDDQFARFRAVVPSITPESVHAALLGNALPLDRPLIRFAGRTAPKGGEEALKGAWAAFFHPRPTASADTSTQASAPAAFAYTDFGTPGRVVADSVESRLGIREIRFANGVRLNLKRTGLEKDRVLVRLSLDGGQMLATKADPLATEMMSAFASGGLGKHSEDELQSILAGRAVAGGLSAAGDVFTQSALTTPRDLALEMQLLAAFVTDPGYRPEGETVYRQNAATFFTRYRATPQGALGFEQGAMLSDDDPRFTFKSYPAYRALTFAQLKATISDRLAHGAIEIGVVGDIDEAATIDAVARTFGALPAREPEFRAWTAERQRSFTAKRTLRIVRHAGNASQAIVRMVWPTRDDSDAQAVSELALLREVVAIEVMDTVREALGKSYSPGAASSPSSIYTGYGTFAVQASVDVHDVAAVRAALAKMVERLNAAPVDADVLDRARAPMLERLDNALKTDGGWLAYVDRAQTESQYIDRLLAAKARLAALTPAVLQRVAQTWLKPNQAVEILVLPDGAPAPTR